MKNMGLVIRVGVYSLLFSVLAACGHGSNATSSQVVAKVNDREITVLQLNQRLQSINSAKITPAIESQAITSLVDEELLVQASIKNKLDRDPAVVAAFERTRRQILAQAYAERVLFAQKPLTLGEDQKYFDDNPALFENRKIYRLGLYVLKAADIGAAVKAELQGAHTPEQLRGALEKNAIQFDFRQVNTPAEEIPLDQLRNFAQANVGDVIFLRQPDGRTLLVLIVGLEAKPVTLAQAKASIEQFLIKSRNAQALKNYLRGEKTVAKISYVGEFAKFFPAADK